jgi:hypothetical protein
MSAEDLPTALLRERDRVKRALRGYEAIGPAGTFALSWIRPALARAERALLEHDAADMVEALVELRGVSE